MKYLNIDCMDKEQGIPSYATEYFDLGLIDVPYGKNVAKMPFTQETNRPCRQKNGSSIIVQKEAYKVKEWDNKVPNQDYFNELFRVTKHQIIFGIDYLGHIEMPKGGRIKWNKGFADGMSFAQYERAYCSFVEHEINLDLLWAGMQQAKSLREPMTQQGNKKLNEKRIHPCHKPILLYQRLISLYMGFVYDGDKRILDTHTGSGSSIIACLKTGFDITAFETDPDYYRDSAKRIENFRKQLKLAI